MRNGRLMLARFAISVVSLSGDEERSGDSGDDRGGVSIGSTPAMAASTRFTISLAAPIEGLKSYIHYAGFLKMTYRILTYRNSSTLGTGAK